MTTRTRTPPIVIEPGRNRGGLWRRAVGMLSMLVAPFIILYGGLIVLMVVLAGSG
jgi:hypothetical protein